MCVLVKTAEISSPDSPRTKESIIMPPRSLYVYAALIALMPASAAAEVVKDQPAAATHEMTVTDRMALARDFVARLSGKLKAADRSMGITDTGDVSGLADGEQLLFQLRLPGRITLQAPVLGLVEDRRLKLSLRDFANALDLPIHYDGEKLQASGWYIRKNKTFTLDGNSRKVATDHGEFTLSSAARVDSDDVYAPFEELAQWFGIEIKPNISSLNLQVASPVPFPIEEKIARQKKKFRDYDVGSAALPRLADDYNAAGVPFVDVSTMSNYRRPGTGEKANLQQSASVRTAGDMLGGTLQTQSQFDQKEKLTNVRVNYKQESLSKDLLGPLKARRFELGDVSPVAVPLNENAVSGLGARITNADPDRSNTRATTRITGTSFPGWEVELYRENQLLGYQTVDDSGLYVFEDVDLNTEDNRFRVVFYGPQGEAEEREVFVPVDMQRLASMGSAYDISVTAQNTQTYRKQQFDDEDNGAPGISAMYEVPVGNWSAVSAGVATRQDNGNQKAMAHAGLSTKALGTLLNFNTAIDNESEMAAEIIARRKIGEHQLRNTTSFATEKYGVLEPEKTNLLTDFNDEYQSNEIFSNNFGLEGPLGWGIGQNPRYTLGLNYSLQSDGNDYTDAIAGYNTLLKPITLGQQFRYRMSGDGEEDRLDSLTNIGGSIGRNRVRLVANYEVMPDNHLKSLGASLRRKIAKSADLELGLSREMKDKLTQGSARINWDAGFINISPGITYNSNRDLAATLNTRFGLARDPISGSIKSYDRLITGYGGASVFVFVDKNGNNSFDEGEEPVEGAIVRAPQSGSREITDEKGYAFMRNLNRMRLTDVFVDPESLADPFWVSGYEGASVLPREGHVASLIFPIHMAGEMDGTIYAKDGKGNQRPLRGVRLGLYDSSGKNIQSVTTETDGFYLFSKIPPGRYYLNVDDANLSKTIARPLPQEINIGYEGTTIYANNIYLEEGKAGIPVNILSDAAYGEHAEEFEGRTIVLNLGSYKSRLMSGLVWFKLRSRHPGLFQNADLVAKPSELVPDDGQHYVLRLSLRKSDLGQAYQTCGVIVRGGGDCTVEILPGGLGQKVAAR